MKKIIASYVTGASSLGKLHQYVVRHGESVANKEKIVTGADGRGSKLDALTDLGIAQAKQLVPKVLSLMDGVGLTRLVIFSSHFQRAVQTAVHIRDGVFGAGKDVVHFVHKGLGEMAFGAVEGMTVDQLKATSKEAVTKCLGCCYPINRNAFRIGAFGDLTVTMPTVPGQLPPESGNDVKGRVERVYSDVTALPFLNPKTDLVLYVSHHTLVNFFRDENPKNFFTHVPEQGEVFEVRPTPVLSFPTPRVLEEVSA